MSVTAARELDSDGGTLLAGYAAHCAALGLAPVSVSNRGWHARAFPSAHPDLDAWMARPTDARLADLARTQAWPLVVFAVRSGQVRIDMDLLAAQRLTSLARSAEVTFPTGFATVRQAADRLGCQSPLVAAGGP